MHEHFLTILCNEFSTNPTTSNAKTFSTFGTTSANMINDNLKNENVLTPPFNFRISLFFVAFLVPYFAFLFILPGVREKRTASFITITIQILVGILLMASLILPYWKVGNAIIVSQFHAHSNLRHESQLGVNVGLDSINITLKYLETLNTNEKPLRGFYLNERYYMTDVVAMTQELRAAYQKGLPYPLLKVMEYFSLSQGAFAWGRLYRNAGYYAGAILWFSFATWIVQCVLLALVPHHYSKAGILCGIFALLSDFVYILNTPLKDLRIPFETRTSETIFFRLHYGSCIYMSFFSGLISLIFGVILSLLQFLRLYSISTCLSGYLDDTIGPKCLWNHGVAAKRIIDNKKATDNGWTTMQSSTSSSPTGSSTSSTNGDNTETYITDETTSTGDDVNSSILKMKKNIFKTNTTETKKIIPGTPDSGFALSRKSEMISTPSTSLILLKTELEDKKQNRQSSDNLKRRANAITEFLHENKWNVFPPRSATLKLPSINNNKIKESETNAINNFKTKKNLDILLNSTDNFLTSSSNFTNKTIKTNISNSKIEKNDCVFSRNESPGIQSIRSSFSNCSLKNDDLDDNVKNSSIFSFTDDEEEKRFSKNVGKQKKFLSKKNFTLTKTNFDVR